MVVQPVSSPSKKKKCFHPGGEGTSASDGSSIPAVVTQGDGRVGGFPFCPDSTESNSDRIRPPPPPPKPFGLSGPLWCPEVRADRPAGWRRWHFLSRIQSLPWSGGGMSLGSKLVDSMPPGVSGLSASGRAHPRVRQTGRARRAAKAQEHGGTNKARTRCPGGPYGVLRQRGRQVLHTEASGLPIRVLRRPLGASGGGEGVSGGSVGVSGSSASPRRWKAWSPTHRSGGWRHPGEGFTVRRAHGFAPLVGSRQRRRLMEAVRVPH